LSTALSGILLLDKPVGLSSNQAVQRVRQLLGRPKAGHVGTLDPLASGMLPICIGEATKIAGEIQSQRKQYQFTISLGARTATGDAEGAVVETLPVPILTTAQITAALQCFLGPQQQTPPMYSAIKQAGQPLYKLARAGQHVERAPRPIEIFSLQLRSASANTLQLDTTCSAGTYIRVLAEDIARALGTCGHVSQLRRTAVEPFKAEQMIPLVELQADALGLLPADYPLQHLPALHLDAKATQALCWGQTVPLPAAVTPGSPVRLYDANGNFMGLGISDQQQLRARRLWARQSTSRIARLTKE
jgi:tRNA pseudouridine55 synthase